MPHHLAVWPRRLGSTKSPLDWPITACNTSPPKRIISSLTQIISENKGLGVGGGYRREGYRLQHRSLSLRIPLKLRAEPWSVSASEQTMPKTHPDDPRKHSWCLRPGLNFSRKHHSDVSTKPEPCSWWAVIVFLAFHCLFLENLGFADSHTSCKTSQRTWLYW